MATTGMPRRLFIKRSALLVAVASSGSILVACGDGNGGATGDDGSPGAGDGSPGADDGAAAAGGTLERAREQGFIRVGFAQEVPYGFANEAGELTGEAPEVARVVLERLGIAELDGVLTEFSSLIPGLQANRFDIIAAGMFITPERCEQILFSAPDYCATQAFAVQSGNPLDLNSYEDVASNPEARLGVLGGAVEEGYALDTGVAESQLQVFPDPPSGIEGLQAGRIDAFALTGISIRNLLETFGGDLELAGPFIPVIDGEEQLGCGAYGFRIGDEEFRDAFNEELNGMLEEGDVAPIVEPFGFGEEEVEAALGTTTQEQCGEP